MFVDGKWGKECLRTLGGRFGEILCGFPKDRLAQEGGEGVEPW